MRGGWSPCTEWPGVGDDVGALESRCAVRRTASASSSLTKYELAPRTSVVGMVMAGHVVPQALSKPVALAERVVAPRPGAVVESLGVVEHAAPQRFPVAVRRGGDGHVQHRGEAREGRARPAPARRRRAAPWSSRSWRSGADGVTSTSTSSGTSAGSVAAMPQRGQSAQRHADDEARMRCRLAQHRPQRLGVELGPVVAVLAPRRAAVAGQVDGQRGHAEAEDHGVPGVRVLSAAVQEHHLRRSVAPLRCALIAAEVDAVDRRQRAASCRSARRSRAAGRTRRARAVRRRRSRLGYTRTAVSRDPNAIRRHRSVETLALDEGLRAACGRCRRAAAWAGSSSGRPTRPRPGRRCRGPWRSWPHAPRR